MKNNVFLKGMKFYNSFDTQKWNFVLDKVKKIINSYGYKEIIFPSLWDNNLFKFIGNESSILKQMYSLKDSKNNIISLRPEGTSICAKLLLNNIKNEKKIKWWYFCTMFRHENPQLGRYREFYQLGLESFGFNSIGIDIELIIIMNKILFELNINKFLNLEINYIGSKNSLNKYKEYLINFIKNNLNLFKKESYLNLYKNPFKILNIKDKNIKYCILNKLLSIKDFLEKHEILKFEKIITLLKNNNINYKINNFLFRGINYYSNIIFEYTTKILGRKISICSGGRYDDLINNLCNKFNIPSIGLAIGWNRLMLIFNKFNNINNFNYDIYITITNNNFLNDIIDFSEEIRKFLPNIKLFVDYSISNIKNKTRFILKKNIKISLIMYKNIYDKKIIYNNLNINEYLIDNKNIILNKLILFFECKIYNII